MHQLSGAHQALQVAEVEQWGGPQPGTQILQTISLLAKLEIFPLSQETIKCMQHLELDAWGVLLTAASSHIHHFAKPLTSGLTAT